MPQLRDAIHFQQILDWSPPVTDSRAALTEWAYDAHNEVNISIGKPSFSMEDFMRKYSPTIKDNQPVPGIASYFVGAAVSGIFHRMADIYWASLPYGSSLWDSARSGQ